MKTKAKHEGYLIIDHSQSPGVPLSVLQAYGKPVIGAGTPGVFECATITCSHCHAVVALNPKRTRERGYCSKCDHYVCDRPECNKECVPVRMILGL